MDLNMPIKHNEINANVKVQTLCLGSSNGLKLCLQSVGRKQWEQLGLVRLGFAHYNLNIYGMASRTELCCVHVGFQGVSMKIKVSGSQTHVKLTTAATIGTYPQDAFRKQAYKSGARIKTCTQVCLYKVTDKSNDSSVSEYLIKQT